MTELCIYQITNTVLKNDLIILVFYGIFTDIGNCETRSQSQLKM